MNEVIRMKSVADLPLLLTVLKAQVKPKTLFLLTGDVGSGKTTTIHALSKSLGMKDVASPTFAIHHRYENSQGLVIQHVDLYRIEDQSDLESTGFWDLFDDKNSCLFVEWADKINAEAWPLNWSTFEVAFTKSNEQREVRVRKIR